MNIPFMRLDRQFAQHKDAIMALCEHVFDHGRVLQGPEVEKLEQQLCEAMGTKEAVAVGSATDALFFALVTAGIKPGDKVAVPAMTFVATASPVIRAGATPVFIDAGDNYQPDITKTIELVNSRTVQAVVATHLYGQLFDITPLAQACHAKGVTLIEDAAQAIGATYNGSSPGADSFAASLSFDPMKVAGAFGSGGAIVTNNPAAAGPSTRVTPRLQLRARKPCVVLRGQKRRLVSLAGRAGRGSPPRGAGAGRCARRCAASGCWS